MRPLPVPLVKLQEIDIDSDGKVDNYKISISFKSDPSQVRRVELLGTFDYYVGDKLKMQFVGLSHLSVNCPLGASKIISNGELVLSQNKAVLIDSIPRTLYNVNPLTA
jgi:hypothetical protein